MSGLRLGLIILGGRVRRGRRSWCSRFIETFTRMGCSVKRRRIRRFAWMSRGQSPRLLLNTTNHSKLTLRRFLADRFVEGTCPRCGYDVRPFPIFPSPFPSTPAMLTPPPSSGRSRRPMRRMRRHLLLPYRTPLPALQTQQIPHPHHQTLDPLLPPARRPPTASRIMDARGACKGEMGE